MAENRPGAGDAAQSRAKAMGGLAAILGVALAAGLVVAGTSAAARAQSCAHAEALVRQRHALMFGTARLTCLPSSNVALQQIVVTVGPASGLYVVTMFDQVIPADRNARAMDGATMFGSSLIHRLLGR